jgi:hypothetical protein
MAQPPHRISDAVLGVENRTNTATGIPPSFLTHHSTSPLPNLESQCSELFWPTAWRDLTSVVHRPQCWQLDSSTPWKMTKMPLRFHHPMTTAGRSCTLLPKDLASTTPLLPKGWVYVVEGVEAEVKANVIDPS